MKKEEISVLVVDDSEHIRALFSMALKKAGIQNILLACDGEEGVDLYQKNLPSITFMDNMMPKLSGLEALEKIRQIKSDAIVVMISAVSSIEVVQEAKKRGASHYLMKPYMPSKVIELIQRLLNVEGLQL
jgi:two-component system, chemotaxis family, chemotaxis protein CheY